MVIRKAQLDSLNADQTRRFEVEMLDHLRSFAPKHCEIIEEEGVRQVVRLGFKNASGYGFTMRGPVRYFIELMFMFGSYFDRDIQHPWAAKALNDPLTPAEMFRAEALHQNMTEYLREVSGPENAFARSALRAIPRLASEPAAAGEGLRTGLIARIQQVYPEKCAWLGPQLLSDVLDAGFTAAREGGVTSDRGRRIFAVLTFTLGHRFAEDPLYPWIAGTLNNPKIADPNQRVERLEAKALLYLENVLRYLEGN